MCDTPQTSRSSSKSTSIIDVPCLSCPKCWDFPHVTNKPKVEVLNRKYCWLYPRYEKKILKKLLPNFDHCETLYTKCDFVLEQCTHQQILYLEDLFKCHAKILEKEMKIQNNAIADLWKISQRYLLLTGYFLVPTILNEISIIYTL